MTVTIEAVGWDALGRYAAIPSVVQVTSVFDVEAIEDGLGGLRLVERGLDHAYTKDYDAVSPPAHWQEAVPHASWRLLLAMSNGAAVGGAAAFVDGSPIATLWDLRVASDARRSGVGRALVEECARWASSGGTEWLRAETQNVNVAACRFYQGLGAQLGAIDRFLYAGQPVADEVALTWYLSLHDA